MVAGSSLVRGLRCTFFACMTHVVHVGLEFIDTVTLAEGLTLTNQSIGAAAISRGLEGVDGIIG